MRAYTDPQASAGVSAVLEFRLDHGVFHARLEDGSVTLADGPAASPDLVVETGDEELLAVLARRTTPAQLAGAGALRLAGDESLLPLVPEIFRLPGGGAPETPAG
jgi:putative sterol carrier protein